MQQRIYLLDNLKLFAMTLVIVSHAVDRYPALYGGCDTLFSGGGILLIINTLCIVRMPLLTIISGLLYKEKNNAKLVNSYLYPCLLFSVIEIISWWLFYQDVSCYTFGWTLWYIWSLFWYMFITPVLLKHISVTKLLAISLILAIFVGFTPLEYTFQLSRLVTFYPFFLIGIWLQKNQDKILDEHRDRGRWILLLTGMLVATAVLFHVYPDIRHYLDFAVPYDSVYSICKRILMYGICVSASVSLIMACQNREYWFTKYGMRTLNAYLCHMAFVIFPISFCLMMPYLHTWYGYLINLVCVPLICCVFYTDAWNKVMNVILLKNTKRDTN